MQWENCCSETEHALFDKGMLVYHTEALYFDTILAVN